MDQKIGERYAVKTIADNNDLCFCGTSDLAGSAGQTAQAGIAVYTIVAVSGHCPATAVGVSVFTASLCKDAWNIQPGEYDFFQWLYFFPF